MGGGVPVLSLDKTFPLQSPQPTGTNQERADASSSLGSWTVSRTVSRTVAPITNINLINGGRL